MYMVITILCAPQPSPHSPTLGILLGLMDRIATECARELSLSQVGCILMYVCVAAPTTVVSWSIALGLPNELHS